MTTETSNARGEVGRFRKRPVVIEAVQWHKPGDHPEVQRFLDTAEGVMGWNKQLADAWGPKFASEFYGIETLEGTMRVSVGDWIIRGVQGEFYPCKPEIFAATYEPADAAPPPAAEGVQAGEVEQRARNLLQQLASIDDPDGRVVQSAHNGRWFHEDAVLRAIVAAMSQQPEARGVVDDDSRARVQDAIAAAIGGMAFDCLRVWEAWQVGTMGQDDFSVIVDDSDRLAEITDAAIAEMQGEAMTIVRKLAALRDGLDNSNSSAEELAARLARRAAALTGDRNG